MKKTLAFLTGLKQNNTISWVQDNSNEYEDARAEVLELIGEVLWSLSSFDKSLDPEINTSFFLNQILRDTRKSKNKDPYLSYFEIRISPRENEGNEPAYQIHIEPGASFISTSYTDPDIFGLQVIRNYITKNFAELEGILDHVKFKNLFTPDLSKSLPALPKGYLPGAAAEKYMKLKSYEFVMPLSDQVLLSGKLVSQLQTAFKAGYPLIKFFRRGLGLVK